MSSSAGTEVLHFLFMISAKRPSLTLLKHRLMEPGRDAFRCAGSAFSKYSVQRRSKKGHTKNENDDMDVGQRRRKTLKGRRERNLEHAPTDFRWKALQSSRFLLMKSFPCCPGLPSRYHHRHNLLHHHLRLHILYSSRAMIAFFESRVS